MDYNSGRLAGARAGMPVPALKRNETRSEPSMTAPKTHARNADEEITPNQAMAGDLGAPVLLLGEDPAA